MSLTTIKTIAGTLGIWPLVFAAFVGLVLAGAVHGPWDYYWFFAMGCWIVLTIYWGLSAHATKPLAPVQQSRLAALGLILAQALYCLPLSSVPLLGQHILPSFVALKILGAVMCAFGVAFAIWARHTLAGNWNTAEILQKGHTLVCDGPYAIVRHPIYFGFLVAAVGMVLVLGEVRALVCLWHTAATLKRMASEENILRAAYPTLYPEYERTVKRLLPYVW